MPREKIHFDKKKLYSLFSDTKATLLEQGAFLSLCAFLFNDASGYHTLHIDGQPVKIQQVQEYFTQHHNMDVASANNIINALVDKNILSVNHYGHLYCPLLYQQNTVSKSKRRIPKNISSFIPVLSDKPASLNSKKKTELVKPISNIVEREINKTIPTPIAANPELMDAQEQVRQTMLFQRKEQPNNIAIEVLQYLNTKCGKPRGYQPNIANLRPIISRIKQDGALLDELKMVIDHKCLEWKDTHLKTNLRPTTLFSPKNYETYLMAAIEFYEQRKQQSTHPLNGKIQKHYPHVAGMTIQMSDAECLKIIQKAGENEEGKNLILELLLKMENDSTLHLHRSVYLRLVYLMEQRNKYSNNGNGKYQASPKPIGPPASGVK